MSFRPTTELVARGASDRGNYSVRACASGVIAQLLQMLLLVLALGLLVPVSPR